MNVVLCCLPASNVGFCRVSRSSDCFCVVRGVLCFLLASIYWKIILLIYIWEILAFYSMKMGNVVCVLTYFSCWRHLLLIYLHLGFVSYTCISLGTVHIYAYARNILSLNRFPVGKGRCDLQLQLKFKNCSFWFGKLVACERKNQHAFVLIYTNSLLSRIITNCAVP